MLKNNCLVYYNYDITFQEIPNEINLTISIMGCQNKCKGCHSPHLRNLNGKALNQKELKSILELYKNNITTVLLLGEGHDRKALIGTIKFIKNYDLKIGLYSGRDEYDNELGKLLDYYKVGSYIQELGGIDKKTTNQRMYYRGADITKKFQN